MRDEMSLEEWVQEVSDDERRALMEKTKKRFIVFLLISIIPFVNFITMGCAIFCYNNWCFLKTRGRNTGNNYVRLLLMLYAMFIPPIIVVSLCSNVQKLGSLVLGW